MGFVNPGVVNGPSFAETQLDENCGAPDDRSAVHIATGQPNEN